MKHDHKKTKKLKVALFAMTMFLPFIAIGVTSATHIFNKEVAEETQTATINYKYELPTTTPTSNTNIENNKLYKLNTQPINDETLFVKYITDGTNTIIADTDTISVEIQPNEILANNIIFNVNTTYIVTIPQSIEAPSFWENLQVGNNNYNQILNVDITTNPTDQTTNIFYDSCEQVKQSFVLNWCAEQNPLRNTIQNFTNVIALPNNHLLNDLITYWLSITLIYVVIDIIIEIFIHITHLFNKEV